MSKWHQEFLDACHESDEAVCILLGNKVRIPFCYSFKVKSSCYINAPCALQCDLHERRTVQEDDGRVFAEKHNMLFREVSALGATGIEEAFQELITRKNL